MLEGNIATFLLLRNYTPLANKHSSFQLPIRNDVRKMFYLMLQPHEKYQCLSSIVQIRFFQLESYLGRCFEYLIPIPLPNFHTVTQ